MMSLTGQKVSIKTRLRCANALVRGVWLTRRKVTWLSCCAMLNKNEGCRLQLGGADQWGNITAGIDLINRMDGPQCYGLTFNLIMRADGKKMGKSENGAVFLDKNMIR